MFPLNTVHAESLRTATRPQMLQAFAAFRALVQERPGEVSSQQVSAVRAMALEARERERVSDAVSVFEALGALMLPVGLLWVLGLGVLLRDHGPVSWQFAAGLAGACMVVLMVRYAWRLQELGHEGEVVEHMTTPLSQLSGNDCEQALQLVRQSPQAAALRDVVVARGEELLVFHVSAMERFVRDEQREAAERARRSACQALHGVAA